MIIDAFREGSDFDFIEQEKTLSAGRLIVFIVLAFAFLMALPARAEKIRTAVPRADLNYLSIYVAEGKGYFKDEGLENETVVIGGPPATAAVVSGGVDYSGAGGSGTRAAITGAPLKAIMYQTDKITWYLVTHPSIGHVSDLRGKKVAVGIVGDSEDRFTSMFVERGGLSAKEITRIPMGINTSSRILAIKTGSIHAAVVDPASAVVAERDGLRLLAFLGDLFPMPFQGFVTTEKKLADNPGEVKRWLRAMVRALISLRDRPEEAAEIGMKRLQLGNISKPLLLEAIKKYIRALPEGVPGLPTPEGVKHVLEYDVRIPMKIKEPFPAERIMDLRWIAEVKKEFEQKGIGK